MLLTQDHVRFKSMRKFLFNFFIDHFFYSWYLTFSEVYSWRSVSCDRYVFMFMWPCIAILCQ